MSKAAFLKSLFGDIAPKAAAPAAGASLMFPSDDADAGLLNAGARASTKLASEIAGFRPPRVVERVSDRPRGVRTEYKGMSDADVSKAYQGLATKIEQGPPKGFRDDPSNTDPKDGFIPDPKRRQGAWEHYSVQGFMHEMTDYDRWGTIVRDGFDNGRGSSDTYRLGMDAMYEEMIERAPKSSHRAIEKYFRNRFRRESRDPFDNYNPNKAVADLDPIPGVVGKGDVPGSGSAPKNSIMEDALRGALEKESPTVGEPAKVNTGRSPADRSSLKKGLLGSGAAGAAGGASAQDAGFPEWSRYEIGPSHGLPTPTWGDVGESLFTVLGAPMAGLQGLARGAYGLATGEGLAGAGAEAAHMMGSRYKGGSDMMTPGFDTAEGWKRYGDFTEESFNKSGAVTPEIAKALGIINRVPEFIVPF